MMEPCRQLWLGAFLLQGSLLHITHEHKGQRQRLEALSTSCHPSQSLNHQRQTSTRMC